MRFSSPLCFAALAVLAATIGWSAPVRADQRIHAERSLYRDVSVYQNDQVRCMVFARAGNAPGLGNPGLGSAGVGSSRQGCIFLQEPDKVVFDYIHLLTGSLFLEPVPKRILIVGLGVGTQTNLLMRVVPGAKIDVVELDPAVVKIARDYFNFRESENTTVTVQDGRVFVKRSGRAGAIYDLIILDAFGEQYIPEHMITREFIQEVKAIMAPRGVLAVNTFSGSSLYDNESVTYQAVFPKFFNLRMSNRIIIARNGDLPGHAELQANAAMLTPALKPFSIAVDKVLSLFTSEPDWKNDARILTDQYSPANLLNVTK